MSLGLLEHRQGLHVTEVRFAEFDQRSPHVGVCRLEETDLEIVQLVH